MRLPAFCAHLFLFICRANSIVQRSIQNNASHVVLNSTLSLSAWTAASADSSQSSIIEQWTQVFPQSGSSSAEEDLECVACQGLLGLFQMIFNEIGIRDTEEALLTVCPAFDKHMPREVCAGLIRQQTPPIAEMFASSNFDALGDEGEQFCYSVLAMCPKPSFNPYTVTFPKPRPKTITRPQRSGQTFTALHLSDWHVQLDYKPGSEARCDNFVCCIGYNTTTTDVDRPAAAYGDYNCDTPTILAENLLDNIQNVSGKPLLSIFTGDIDDHAIWRDTESYSINASEIGYTTLHRYIDAMDLKMYPTFGNHESGPANQYASTTQNSTFTQQWLYDLEAKLWSGWLGDDALEMLRNSSHGSYSIQPVETPNLRIIAINTNLGYIDNWYTYWQTDESDPSGIFTFLINELQAAEDEGQAAWIIMHVPPTQSDTLLTFSNSYLQIIQRYNDTITGQFAGHTHRDEFSVEYSDQSSFNGITAAGVIYIGPSVSPYTSLNPGWRTYDVDSGSYEIMDSHTYIANLSLSSTWSSTNLPTWFQEYSARSVYVPSWPASEPLTPAFWDAAADAILEEKDAWDLYFFHRGKSSGMDGTCAFGDECQLVIARDLKAGQADDYTTPIGGTRKRTHVKREASRPHQRKGLQSWERSLCGGRPSLAGLFDGII